MKYDTRSSNPRGDVSDITERGTAVYGISGRSALHRRWLGGNAPRVIKIMFMSEQVEVWSIATGATSKGVERRERDPQKAASKDASKDAQRSVTFTSSRYAAA